MMFEIHVMGEIIAISTSDVISLVAGVIAVVAVVYARKSAKEAERANNMGRLNALLSFRAHYLELMRHQETRLNSLNIAPAEDRLSKLCMQTWTRNCVK